MIDGDITLYDLVVTDRASGRKRVLTDLEPVTGRAQAEENLRRVERANRDPNLQYTVEPSRRRRVEEDEIPPEALLTHKFHAF